MAKGDTGGGAMGMMSRMKQPMSNTNDMGEQKPMGWQHLVQPTMGGNGGAPPEQTENQMPQQSMFQKGNMAQNMGRMGNMMGQFNGGMNQQPGFSQGSGFNAGPNRGIFGGGFSGGMARPQIQGPNGESPNQRGGFMQRFQGMMGGGSPYRMFGR